MPRKYKFNKVVSYKIMKFVYLKKGCTGIKCHEKTRIVRESDYSPASQLFCRVKKTMTGNYHKLDLVNIDAHTKFGLVMSIRSQDIERKRKSDLNKGP